jgi:hypothetical protein
MLGRKGVICLEVCVNGTKVCTAGGEDLVATSANVYAFVFDDGEKRWTLSVRGQTSGGEMGESRCWVRQDLAIGDTITVHIVERESCDPPETRYHHGLTSPCGVIVVR